MREIKFRVRDSGTKELLGYEVFNTTLNDGFYYVDYSEPEGERICYTNYSERPMLKPKHPAGRLLREEFTGLTDRNGVEIYEGDILEVPATFGTSGKHPKAIGPILNVKAIVVFRNGRFDYCHPPSEYTKRIDHGNATDWYRGYPDITECEVIGSLHQNPELLEIGND